MPGMKWRSSCPPPRPCPSSSGGRWRPPASPAIPRGTFSSSAEPSCWTRAGHSPRRVWCPTPDSSCCPGGADRCADPVVPVFTHPDCLRHDPGPDHPETPARLRVLLERARRDVTASVIEAAPAPRPALLAVHPDGYLRGLEEMSARGGGALFLDTILNHASWAAALGAAGAVLAAVDYAHAGRGNAFAAGRPPGHHALAGKGMGFCLLNNVVIGARHAQ